MEQNRIEGIESSLNIREGHSNSFEEYENLKLIMVCMLSN